MTNPRLRRNALLLYFIIIGLFLFVMCSCSPRISAIVPESGRIIEQDGDRLLIMWKNIGTRPNSYSWEWFYIPGIGKLDDMDNYEVVFTIQPKHQHDPAH